MMSESHKNQEKNAECDSTDDSRRISKDQDIIKLVAEQVMGVEDDSSTGDDDVGQSEE